MPFYQQLLIALAIAVPLSYALAWAVAWMLYWFSGFMVRRERHKVLPKKGD